MAKLDKLMALSVVSETTQGTAVGPAATDFIPLIEKPTVKPIVEITQRHNFREALGKLPFSTGWSYSDVSFKVEWLGASATNTAYAPIDTLFKACGMTVTGGTGGTDWTYALSSTNISNHLGPATACTINYFVDGLKHIVQGFVGSPKVIGEAGQTPIIEFTGKGLYTAVTDTAIPTTTFTHNTTIPKMKSASLGWDGTTTAYVQKIEFDFGNKIEFVPDVSSTNGLAGFRIVDRDIKATINPEMGTVAAYDWWAKYVAGTTMIASSVGVGAIFGNGARNFATIVAIRTQILDAKYGTRNGIVTLEVDLQCNDNTENDALSIVVDNA